MTKRRNKITHKAKRAAVEAAARFTPGTFTCSYCNAPFPYATQEEHTTAQRNSWYHLTVHDHQRSRPEIDF